MNRIEKLFWGKKFVEIKPIENITNLPAYSHSFLFKNLGPYKTSFILLTVIAVISTITSFFSLYLVSDLISNVADTTVDRLLKHYLPLYLILMLTTESLNYFTRKYSEAFPPVFDDYTRIRFYKTILNSRFERILGFSKEKINQVISMYIAGINEVLYGWFWNWVGYATKLVIVILILAILNPAVLIINLVLLSLFLIISLYLSNNFSKYAKAEARVYLDANSTIDSFKLNLNAIKKNQLGGFFYSKYNSLIAQKWVALKGVRDFHSKRWFVQLLLFNIIHVVTLFYGIYQVIEGGLPIGFLVLIEWAYSQLWQILVFVIEYRVRLILQKENTKLANKTFATIIHEEKKSLHTVEKWDTIQLEDIKLKYKRGHNQDVNISIPQFTINKGDKIGVVGESGSGKSTLLHILLQIINYRGQFLIDGKEIGSKKRFNPYQFTLIDNDSPLFNITLRENLLLGKDVSEKKLMYIMESLKISQFENEIEKKYGESADSYSAGQIQRLRLARGVLQDTEVYLLDEPLNGIDSKTKVEIRSFLADFLKDKTVVLVSHIRDDLNLVNQIYAMKDGVLLKDN